MNYYFNPSNNLEALHKVLVYLHRGLHCSLRFSFLPEIFPQTSITFTTWAHREGPALSALRRRKLNFSWQFYRWRSYCDSGRAGGICIV